MATLEIGSRCSLPPASGVWTRRIIFKSLENGFPWPPISTLKSAICADLTINRSAMESYIALSRATDAEGLLITRPFLPKLFRQGPQPFPTYLLQVLNGLELAMSQCQRIQDKIKNAGKKKNFTLLLKSQTWKCAGCDQKEHNGDFLLASYDTGDE